MTELHIACATDSAYVPHSAAMLHSAISHGGSPLVVHFLHGPQFPAKQASKLQGMFSGQRSELVFHEVLDLQLQGLPLDHRFGPAMWYRIFLPELLPDVTQVLYLDADTLVVDGLDPLWETDLDGCYLAAVANVFMEYHRHRGPELGIELADYFNSGVLMFNLVQMRAENFAGKLIELVNRRGSQLAWPDQDALNLTAQSRWVRLHPRWNVMNSFTSRPQLAAEVFGAERLAAAVANPAVRHFEGPAWAKPWHAGHQGPGRELYRQHREATPWPRIKLEGNSPLDRFKRLVRRRPGGRGPRGHGDTHEAS
jgi:lipopolysaccharide biosynthesis glycosyltransferase